MTGIIDLPTEYVSWFAPVEGLWVASTPTSYVGMVDRNHDGFVATDCTGRELGVYGALESARVAVYGAWVAPELPERSEQSELPERTGKPQQPVSPEGAATEKEHDARALIA